LDAQGILCWSFGFSLHSVWNDIINEHLVGYLRELRLTLVLRHFFLSSSVHAYKLIVYLYSYFFHFFTLTFVDVVQTYETRAGDVFVIIGNDALVKCSVPSYAADFMEIVGWVTNEDYEITNLVDGNQNN
jgi:hypothetical protein